MHRPTRAVLLAGAVAAALAAAPAAAPAAPVSPDLVISQVYGGGGNTNAPYTHDFVELFNRGDAPVSLAGRSIQYASATGTGSFGATSGQITALPDVTLAPGQHFLVQQGGGATGQPLPAPDATGSILMAAGGGKVALADRATPLGCNGSSTPCDAAQLADVRDLVGYGNANFFEGSAAAPAPSATLADLRGDGGCADTGENDEDLATAAPAPRNTASPAAPCTAPPVDTAPAVATSEPADGDDWVAEDADLGVTFDEPVTAGEGAFALRCADAAVALTVAGGPEAYTLDPAGPLPRGADCALTVRADAVRDQDGTPDAPAADHVVRFHVAEQCDDPARTIPAIQGDGAASPLTGDRVSTEGVVVGDFQGDEGDGSLGGFFLQDPAGDGDRATSDGIFVYAPSGTPEVREGDVVRVRGTVAEYRRDEADSGTLTELTGTIVAPCGETAALPRPARLRLPRAAADLERLEGMLVRTRNHLTVTELYSLRFGEVLLSAFGPLVQPTDVVPPGRAAAALDRVQADATILLDDGRSSSNLDPIRFTSDADALRRGDELRGSVTGALAFDFDAYRIQPTSEPAFAERNPRPRAPEPVGGDVTAGSFNVLNYFITYGRREDRGAPNPAEQAQQEAKIVAAINRLDAAVVGLQEIQDTSDEPAHGNDPDAALDRLVAALNAAAGHAKWAKSPAPQPFGNTDEIRVAQIYQPARVERVGDPVAFNDPAFIGIARVPIAQTYRSGRETFTVVANHFKSKGCDDATGADTDRGDGQSCYNATRVAQAQALLRFVAERREATGDDDVLVVGDLNAYAQEDPIRTLERGGLVDLHERFEHRGDRYSYVFHGRQGVLDHGLATRSLAAKVTGSDLWHVNADEARPEEYGGFDELYTADPYRASDHDATKVGFRTGRR